MDNREKLKKMDRALRLMEDLKQSQVAMVEKSSKLQLDAMEFNFSEMEKNMGDLFSRYNESLELIETELERFVRDKLDEQVSPELIAGRLQRDHPNQSAMHISAEAIYQWIYRMAQRGVDLYQKLYQRRKRRRPRTVGKRTKKGVIVDRVGIEQRPVTVDERKRFGDWESDTIEGAKGTGVIVTHVERKSRLVRLARLDSKHAAPLSQATNRLLGKLPKCLRRTMTADNGTEFADFKTIEQGLGVKVYFANPHSPWERGLNENTNGILRRWLPKGSDFSKVTNKQLAEIQRMMNNRPRKCLNYRTPLEVINALPGVALRN
jgi:IS30 family transposase